MVLVRVSRARIGPMHVITSAHRRSLRKRLILVKQTLSARSELLGHKQNVAAADHMNEYLYFRPSITANTSGKLADMFTNIECFLWQGGFHPLPGSWRRQDSETATTAHDAAWTECMAARDDY